MEPRDLAVELLIGIRDEIRATNVRLDRLSDQVEGTSTRLDRHERILLELQRDMREVCGRVEMTSDRVESLESKVD